MGKIKDHLEIDFDLDAKKVGLHGVSLEAVENVS